MAKTILYNIVQLTSRTIFINVFSRNGGIEYGNSWYSKEKADLYVRKRDCIYRINVIPKVPK